MQSGAFKGALMAKHSWRRSLQQCLSGIAMAMLSVASAVAEDAEPALDLPSPPSAVTDLGEIIVTGSRIAVPDFEFSNPVVSIGRAEMENSGTTNLVDYLKTQPALIGSLDSNEAAGSNTFVGGTGLALLDLRNLGYERTLVLVDGRRHVSGLPGSAAVDIDTIPTALIERIEVLTGGASAIYGADGVSGVVNFIMRRDFEGVDLQARAGRSAQGDADTRKLSAVLGRNFASGRANVTGALEFSSENRLRPTQRKFAGGGSRRLFANNPADPDDDPTIPDRIPLADLRFYDSSAGGAIDLDGDYLPDLNADGSAFDPGVFVPPFFQQGGDGTSRDRYIGDLTPEERRYTANVLLTFDLNPQLRLFGDFKYARNQAFSQSQPTFDYGLQIESDNAFLPASILQASGGEPVYMARDNFDLGVRGEDIKRQTIRTVIGAKGDLDDHLRFEVSYVFGQTEVDNRISKNRYNDRFAAALDSVIDPDTGQPVCRSNLDPQALPANLELQGWTLGSFTPGANSGCVPLNLFGEGSPSREAAAWIMTNSLGTARLEQQVVQAYLSGSSEDWLQLPAGAIGYAGGAEYRYEGSRSTPPIEDQLGLTFGGASDPVRGRFEVTEFFAEVTVPLLLGQPFAEHLSLDAALRYSDYTTIGQATTWKTGFSWAPVNDVTLRGTLAEATRAPNIGELFDPGGQTFQFIDDPCDVDRLDEGSSFRAANCAQLLTSLGVDPQTYTDPNSSSISGTLRGNTALKEEVAKTKTLGVVLRPRFAPDLTLSLDWYDIKLSDAINAALPQEAADNCVDLPTLDNNFCSLVTRQSGGAGAGGINAFIQQPLNVASFTTEGIDFNLLYLLNPAKLGAERDWGTYSFRLVGNHLRDLTFVNLPNAEPDKDAGEEDAPEWQASFDLGWERGPWFINYGISYFNRTQRIEKQVRDQDPDVVERRYYDYNKQLTQDLLGRYRFTSGLALEAGVNNFTDQKPDIGEVFYPVSAVGRFYFVGLYYTSSAK